MSEYPTPLGAEGMIYSAAIRKIRNPNAEFQNKFKYQIP